MYRAQDKYLAYMSLTSLTQETMETKKIHVSSMYRSQKKIGHSKGCMTSTYKVTCQGHVSGLHAIDFLDPRNHGNNNKNMSLACIDEIR